MGWHLAFLISVVIPCVRADEWDDFAGNLATDLAPLITLFGDRLTKQFLSESISLLDNVIFAFAPLGILTAVVSVIRVCGNSSLRAFIGRAQEGPGEAENELLSCVSETTAELFNAGGISRVFGRPRILEVFAWEEEDEWKEKSVVIGTLREALKARSWCSRHDAAFEDLSALDIPNLSLNKGIKRRSQGWFYCATLLGSLLQVAVVVYSAFTVFVYPSHFKHNDKLVPAYAFPFFILGTVLLTTGMFLCAFMIERSSREYYFHPVQPSKIYWLQPGHQKVGDQVFGAFMGANEGPDAQLTTDLSYIKSTKSPKYNDKKSQLFLTVSLTVFGFVVQFVGLRGLHPSIIMAQMGATLIMSIVRTCLRTKRIDLRENQLSAKDLDLTHHNRQELDCFAFHLENIGSFELLSPASELLESQYNFSDTALVAQPTKAAPRNTNIIRTRTRLAELTSGADKPQNMIWDDLPIREIARNLARAIEATMDLLSTWTNKPDRVFEFKLAFRCEILGSALHILDYHVIRMDRSDDTLQWRINDNELEAILGLWTWSLLNTTPNWTHRPLFRLIGLDETEAASEETDLYFQKWIFRQTEARMVSSSMIHSPHRLFGYSSDNDLLDTKEILVVKTQNRVEVMATQDLYIRFLDTVFGNLDQLGGTTDIHPGSQGSFLVRNTRVDELVHCFESFNLGSREDALLCIVPVLKRQGVLPELAADSPCIRSRVEELVSAGNWNEAYDVLRWLCERCEGDEFERSIFELGFLCRKALLHDNPGVRNTGVGVVCQLLQKNIRAEYFRGLRYPRKNSWMHSTAQDGWWSLFTSQLRWMVWQICKDDPKMESIKYILVSRGQGMLGETLHFDNNETDVARYTNILVQWLALPDDLSFALEISESDNQSCFLWALGYGHVALANWLLIRWAEVCQHWQVLGRLAFGWAAASPSESAIETLCRHGCDINGVDKPPKGGHTALLQAVGDGDEGAVRKLLGNGADADAGRPSDNLTPLMLACQQGRCQIARLLVTYGADVDSRDWSGTTALPWAARNGYLDIVYLLLSNGADICSSGCNGMTALHYAASNNHSSLVDLLLTRGADVNAVDEKGSSPLILASRANLVDTIRLLLSRGANTHTKDQSGMGALEWARECQHQEAVFLLDKAQISTSR